MFCDKPSSILPALASCHFPLLLLRIMASKVCVRCYVLCAASCRCALAAFLCTSVCCAWVPGTHPPSVAWIALQDELIVTLALQCLVYYLISAGPRARRDFVLQHGFDTLIASLSLPRATDGSALLLTHDKCDSAGASRLLAVQCSATVCHRRL